MSTRQDDCQGDAGWVSGSRLDVTTADIVPVVASSVAEMIAGGRIVVAPLVMGVNSENSMTFPAVPVVPVKVCVIVGVENAI